MADHVNTGQSSNYWALQYLREYWEHASRKYKYCVMCKKCVFNRETMEANFCHPFVLI